MLIDRFQSREEYLASSYVARYPERLRFENAALDSGGGRLRAHCWACGSEQSLDAKPVRSAEGVLAWRETLRCPVCKLTARKRFGLHLLHEAMPAGAPPPYLTEQVSWAFLAARRHWPGLIGSEFLRSRTQKLMQNLRLNLAARTLTLSVRHQDLTRLTLGDASVGGILCMDVLEHIPDTAAVLREARRVLVAGAPFVITAPFLNGSEATSVRAVLEPDGTIRHLLEPEYHGDPLDRAGVLCFYHFGWDLLAALRSAGFTRVETLFAWDPHYGYLSEQSAFVAYAGELPGCPREFDGPAGERPAAGADVSSARDANALTTSAAVSSLSSEVPTTAGLPVDPVSEATDYERRSLEESRRFALDINVHDLPPIFHYWSNTHLRPMLETFGFSSPDDLYVSHIARRCAGGGLEVLCLSIGAGNCDTELRVGQELRRRGLKNWHVTCLDLVPEMLERGRAAADAQQLSSHFSFLCVDINQWEQREQRYDVVLANQCLHHFVELESVFDRVAVLLRDGGNFLTSDMIGRNGHQRWPEARVEVERFWEELPAAYRYNQQLQRHEDAFLDWDCSSEGFEGIRSQDILPLLRDRFGFELFLGFGNVIDPFIDRSFGWNFNADAEWDRDFIDRVHAADEAGLERRSLAPTHMLAILTLDKQAKPRTWRGRTPRESIRKP